MKDFIWTLVITIFFIGYITIIWIAEKPLANAQLEFACLEHRGEKSNFLSTVRCNDGAAINDFDTVGNEWIYNRSLEIKNLDFIENIKYNFSRGN